MVYLALVPVIVSVLGFSLENTIEFCLADRMWKRTASGKRTAVLPTPRLRFCTPVFQSNIVTRILTIRLQYILAQSFSLESPIFTISCKNQSAFHIFFFLLFKNFSNFEKKKKSTYLKTEKFLQAQAEKKHLSS